MDAYLSTVYEPECEYVDGEIVERNCGEVEHAATQGALAASLFPRRRELGIHVFMALRMRVSETRNRVPDITVTTQKGKGRILREAPFLCIEVLSPEDRASRMQEKIDDYLAFGVGYVWVANPRTRRGYVYTVEGMREAKDGVLRTANPEIALSLKEVV